MVKTKEEFKLEKLARPLPYTGQLDQTSFNHLDNFG